MTSTIRVKKEEIIKTIAEKLNITKKSAEEYFNTVFETILEKLKSESKKIKNDEKVILKTPLGTIKVIKTKKRKGVNPKTGEEIIIPAKVKIKLNKTIE